jgi:hypothetical protein
MLPEACFVQVAPPRIDSRAGARSETMRQFPCFHCRSLLRRKLRDKGCRNELSVSFAARRLRDGSEQVTTSLAAVVKRPRLNPKRFDPAAFVPQKTRPFRPGPATSPDACASILRQ